VRSPALHRGHDGEIDDTNWTDDDCEGEAAMSWLRRCSLPVISGIGILGALVAVGPAGLFRGPALLASGTDFTITSTVTAQPGCTTAALLYPGLRRCLTYSVTNNLSDPITVQKISLAADPNFPTPTGCQLSNLDLSNTTFTGSYTVAPGATRVVPAALTSL
jgi:hypothetical protein